MRSRTAKPKKNKSSWVGNYFRHLRAWRKQPAHMGAIAPSSAKLARAMASKIQLSDQGIVVELGPGTGVITQAILNHGVCPKRLIAIEYNPQLVKRLQHKFPDIQVIHGDAQLLAGLLDHETRPIEAIVSGLPLWHAFKPMNRRVLQEIPRVLSPSGRFIQFTYDLRPGSSSYPKQYQLIEKKTIWRNIPPAKVGVYQIVP